MTNIIDAFIAGSLRTDQIKFSTHYEKRLIERDLDRDYVRNLILNEEPLDIADEANKNHFKLYYPSENPNYQLIVTIVTKADFILVTTVYENKKR